MKLTQHKTMSKIDSFLGKWASRKLKLEYNYDKKYL